MDIQPVNVALIGCGNISNQYLERAKQFPILKMHACSDLDLARAKAQAEKHGVPNAWSVDEVLSDPSIEIVVNLTIPAAHAEVSIRALEAGKHVYSEKPLATTTDDGRRILDTARARSRRVACAPDTFLGIGHQTARHAIDSGMIGRPVAALALMLSRGPEGWHPDPAFFYQPGGGPMFDMGPYYLTELINLMGPIARVCGISGVLQPDRVVGSGANEGTRLNVTTDDHIAGSMQFAGGGIGTIVTSFASKHAEYDRRHPIQIIGTEGTLRVPDPNAFEGDVLFKKDGVEEWQTLEPTHNHPGGRSLGVADLAHAIRTGRPHRATGELAFAVLDAMEGFIASSQAGRYRELSVDYAKPAMMPTNAKDGILD